MNAGMLPMASLDRCSQFCSGGASRTSQQARARAIGAERLTQTMWKARQGLSALGLLGSALQGEAAAMGLTAAAPAAGPAALALRGGPQSLWARLYAALPAGVTEDDRKALSEVSARPPPPPLLPVACLLLSSPAACACCCWGLDGAARLHTA